MGWSLLEPRSSVLTVLTADEEMETAFKIPLIISVFRPLTLIFFSLAICWSSSTVFFCKAAWLNSAFISAGKAAGVDEKEIRGLALVVASLAAELRSQAIAEASWKSVPSKGNSIF